MRTFLMVAFSAITMAVFVDQCRAAKADAIEDELSRAREVYKAAVDKARLALLNSSPPERQ